MKKGIVSIFFVVLGTTVLLVNAFNQYGSAGGSDNADSVNESVSTMEEEIENDDGNETEILSWNEAVEAARAHMVQRDTSFSLCVEPTENGAEMIKDVVTTHTGVPDEGNYLEKNSYNLNPTVSRMTDYDVYTFSVSYYTTKEQEDYVTSRINEVLTQLGVYTMNKDLDKITAIYQWITDHVTYDYEHLGDSSYLLKGTAYAALHDGTAVCQGCATLLYRMILTAGVDCRCVGGENHVWNIISLDGVYYNADVTWDLGVDPENYSYFLKGSVSFGEDHIRLAEFDTDQFRSTYFVPDQDYILPTKETVEKENETITNENDNSDTGTVVFDEKNREEIEDETGTEDPINYVKSLSEINNSALVKMKSEAINVYFEDFESEVSENFKVQRLDYIGSYFLTAREGTKTDIQNRIIFIFKVTVILAGRNESGEVTSELLEYYTCYEFDNATIEKNGEICIDYSDCSVCENAKACVIMDASQPEESNQAETVIYFGYSDLDEAFNDIVLACAGQYDYESTV